jgi:hypothetical protein
MALRALRQYRDNDPSIYLVSRPASLETESNEISSSGAGRDLSVPRHQESGAEPGLRDALRGEVGR